MGLKNDHLKMLAEGLAAHGVASLRYDKRGIGESAPGRTKEEDVRLETFIDDAVLWGKRLQDDRRFRGLAVVGHSEGSLIGMVAAQKLASDGFVSVAGAGRPAPEIILDQLRPKLPADLMKQAEETVNALKQGRKVESVAPALNALFRPSVQPYLISWFKYDPAKEIARLAMPVLILQGTTDIQVSVSEAKLLSQANPSAKLVVIDGMNHVLKAVPNELDKQLQSYKDPAMPVVPKLVDEIAAFMNRFAFPNTPAVR